MNFMTGHTIKTKMNLTKAKKYYGKIFIQVACHFVSFIGIFEIILVFLAYVTITLIMIDFVLVAAISLLYETFSIHLIILMNESVKMEHTDTQTFTTK